MNNPKSIQDALLIFMKISFTQIIISIIFSSLLKANDTNGQEILDKRVTLELHRQEIKDVLWEIEIRIGVHFTYRSQLLAREDKISVDFKNQRLEDILKSILPSELVIEVIDNQIIIENKQEIPSLEKGEELKPSLKFNVSGLVSDEQNQPMPGVNVIVKGTTNGVSTDVNGKYTLEVEENSMLVFSFLGYLSEEITVGTRSIINVQLLPNIESLKEVIVIGYGTTEKKEFAGAVASITSKEVEKLPTLSVSSALQGQASGVYVSSNSGTLGGGVSVRVRGQTSVNAGNDPLYIVDGVPVVSGNTTIETSNLGLGGQNQNALAGINPQDVESIEVLKDAASTAIYGSRASNGVVLITTKRGKSGQSKISISGWIGAGEVVNTSKSLNSQEWVDVQNEARVNAGLPSLTNTQWGWDGKTNTDWIKAVFRQGRVSEYQASISGGDEKTKYYLSGSLRQEDGALIGTSYSRATGRMNIDHKVSGLFQIGSSISVASETNNRMPNDNNQFGIYTGALLNRPTSRIVDDAGNYVDGAIALSGNNPVREASINRYQFKTLKLIGNVNTNFKLSEGLDFKTDLSYDYTTSAGDMYVPASSAQGRGPNGGGSFSWQGIGTYAVEPTLRFNRKFNNVHDLKTVIGATLQETNIFISQIEGISFPRPELTYLTSAATITSAAATKLSSSYSSLFARLSYSYSGKYIGSATLRRDGSSKFGQNNRYAVFYAFSLGWNFSKESFMRNIEWLSIGKLRTSYGITGNSNIGFYPWQGYWSSNANYLGQNGWRPQQIENPDLKWETSSTTDVGLELGFFKNRLNLNIGYFTKNTSDLLYIQTLPGTTGFTSYAANIGSSQNSGTEIELSSTLLELANFQWSIKSNITFLENKLISLVNEYAPDGSQVVISAGYGSVIAKGRPLNSFIGLSFLGVDPRTGATIYRDFNNDGLIDQKDVTFIGNGNPKYMGGFTNTLSYKGLTLDVFFQFVAGNDVYNYTNQRRMILGAPNQPDNALGLSSDFSRRWRNPGDLTDVPKADYNDLKLLDTYASSRFISDGSYLRLKNVSLAYDFKASVISKIKLQSLRIYFTGSNLLTFTGYSGPDPEVSTFGNTSTAQGTDYNTLPQTKMYTFGVKLGF